MNSKDRRGFTLVELLVVIGIIALLISILLPSLAAARRQANTVKCEDNLHQIAIAAMIHATTHQGYFPLSGKLFQSYGANLELTPAGNDDPYQLKYDYYGQSSGPFGGGTQLQVLDMPAALNRELNGHIRLDSQANIIADVQGGVLGKVFACPDDPFLTQGCTIIGSNGGIIGMSTNNSYNFNEDVLGHDGNDVQNALGYRLCGNVKRVRRPSEDLFLGDGFSRTNATGPIKAFVSYSGGTTATSCSLGDVYGNFDGLHNGIFDLNRHGHKINVAFFDGHVQTYALPKLLPGVITQAQAEASDIGHVGMTWGFPGVP